MNKMKIKDDSECTGQVLVYNKKGEAKLSGVTISTESISKDDPSYGALVTEAAVKEFVNENTLSKDTLISDSTDLTEENVSNDKVATAKAVLDALTWKDSVNDDLKIEEGF